MIKLPPPSSNILKRIQPRLMKDTYKKVHVYLFDFQIVLGKGSFSTVYKGINLQTNQQVAIKVITMDSITNPKMKQLLTHQIDILMKIKHENLIKCFEVLSSAKHTYVIMEICTHDLQSVLKHLNQIQKKQATKHDTLINNFSILPSGLGKQVVDSFTFRQSRRDKQDCFDQVQSTKSLDVQSNCGSQENKRLPQEKFYPFINQIFNGLLYLADQNIIHRDLKLSNIFIKDGVCKIGDFGFCTKIPSNQIQIRDTCCIGSPLYMAPQSYLKNIYNRKTDVWSFGIIIFQLLFGNPPLYQCQSHQILRRKIVRPINWRKYQDISSQLKQLLEGCLQVQFSKRFSLLQISQSSFFKKINKKTKQLYNQNSFMNQNLSFVPNNKNQEITSELYQNQNQQKDPFLQKIIFQNYSTIEKKGCVQERPKTIQKQSQTDRFGMKHNRSCLGLRPNNRNQTFDFSNFQQKYKKNNIQYNNKHASSNTSTFYTNTNPDSFKSTYFKDKMQSKENQSNISRFYATADNFNFHKSPISPLKQKQYSPKFQVVQEERKTMRQKSPTIVKYQDAKKSYEKFMNDRKSTQNLLKNTPFMNIPAQKFSQTFTGGITNKSYLNMNENNLKGENKFITSPTNNYKNYIQQKNKLRIQSNNSERFHNQNPKRITTEQSQSKQQGISKKSYQQKWSQFKTTKKQNSQFQKQSEQTQMKNGILQLKKVNLKTQPQKRLQFIQKQCSTKNTINEYKDEKLNQKVNLHAQMSSTANSSFLFNEFKTPTNNQRSTSTLVHNFSCINLKKQNTKQNFDINLNNYKKDNKNFKQTPKLNISEKSKFINGQVNYRDCIDLVHFCRLLYKISFFANNDHSISILNFSIGVLEDLFKKCQNFQLKFNYKNQKIDGKQAIQMDYLKNLSVINQKECCQKINDRDQNCTKNQKLLRIINEYIKKYCHRKEALKKLSECNAILENITNTANSKVKEKTNKNQNFSSLAITDLNLLLKKLYLQKNNKNNSQNNFSSFLNKRNSKENKKNQNMFSREGAIIESDYTVSQYEQLCYLKLASIFCKNIIQCNFQKSFQKLTPILCEKFTKQQDKSIIQILIEAKGNKNDKASTDYYIFLKDFLEKLKISGL